MPSLDRGQVPPGISNSFDAVTSATPHTLFAVGTQRTPTLCCTLALAERTTNG